MIVPVQLAADHLHGSEAVGQRPVVSSLCPEKTGADEYLHGMGIRKDGALIGAEP